MHRNLLWASLVGFVCANACFVPSFTVDPDAAGATSAEGGTDSSSAGKNCGDGCLAGDAAEGGATGNGATGNGATGNGATGNGNGGTGNGGTGNGGTGNGATGNGGTSDGEAGNGEAGNGEAGNGGAGNGASTPVRVGFSVFHDSASGSDQASSHLADAEFMKPAVTKAGDLLLVFFGADHSLQNLTGNGLAAAGWTLQDQRTDYGTDGQAMYLIYRIADGTEPDPIVFKDINPVPSGNGVQGLLAVYRGVNALEPINAYDKVVVPEGDDREDKHVETPTPELTTTVDGCLLIAGLSPDSHIDAPVVSFWPDGFTLNHTSVTNPPTPYPNGWANIYTAERPQPQAGTVPASKFGWDMTYDGISWWGALSFVLALAPE